MVPRVVRSPRIFCYFRICRMIALPKVYFERLLEISPDIVIAVDREGKIVFYNDGAERTLGYSEEELLGEDVVGKVLGSAAFRSFARSAASALGRELTRGLFGTRRRR